MKKEAGSPTCRLRTRSYYLTPAAEDGLLSVVAGRYWLAGFFA